MFTSWQNSRAELIRDVQRIRVHATDGFVEILP
jgi:hypothetical protein